jgi:hypothetical protein
MNEADYHEFLSKIKDLAPNQWGILKKELNRISGKDGSEAVKNDLSQGEDILQEDSK